jgi:hypothetical protein
LLTRQQDWGKGAPTERCDVSAYTPPSLALPYFAGCSHKPASPAVPPADPGTEPSATSSTARPDHPGRRERGTRSEGRAPRAPTDSEVTRRSSPSRRQSSVFFSRLSSVRPWTFLSSRGRAWSFPGGARAGGDVDWGS